MKMKSSIFLLAILAVIFSCQQAETVKLGNAVLELPAVPYSYDSINGNNNIPTLGRVLFYDPRLSINSTVSCSSCHKQALAFADNVAHSTGYQGAVTFRNSMPIQNLNLVFDSNVLIELAADSLSSNPVPIFFDTLSLFWDGRVKLLEAMVLRPITNHVEMGITDLDGLAVKLSKFGEYQELFAKAYGTPEITQMKIADALSNFLKNIRSNNSPFDKSRQNPATLSAEEQVGHALFNDKYNCNSCHQIDAVNGYQLGGGFVNIGLDPTYVDPGFADVSGLSTDLGKFKIPTLRNVALTAPYMHDGRFQTLDDVLDHYSNGIVNHPNLDPRLRDGDHPLKMNISEADRAALKAFLSTLTDRTMITDVRLSNPFVVK